MLRKCFIGLWASTFWAYTLIILEMCYSNYGAQHLLEWEKDQDKAILLIQNVQYGGLRLLQKEFFLGLTQI